MNQLYDMNQRYIWSIDGIDTSCRSTDMNCNESLPRSIINSAIPIGVRTNSTLRINPAIADFNDRTVQCQITSNSGNTVQSEKIRIIIQGKCKLMLTIIYCVETTKSTIIFVGKRVIQYRVINN